MRPVLALSAVALSIVLLGCGDSDPVGPRITESEVRIAHLSPDAPPVDVWVDGTRVLSSVPFKAVSDYLTVEAGTHRIQVTPAGASEPVVIDATVTLAGTTSYTVAATGLLGTGDLSPVVLIDERGARSDEARVRFVHAAPDAPAVDVAANGGPVIFRNVSFRQSEGYLSVDPGPYSLQVRPAGATTVVLNLENITLRGNDSYTAFAVGRLGDGSLTAVLVEDTF